MRHLLLTGLGCVAALLTACSDDPGFSATERGSVKLTLDVDRSVMSAQPSRSSLDDICASISPDDFTVSITGEDGETKEWPFASFDGQNIPIGSVTVAARYGEPGREGFDAACFYGEQTVKVLTDQTTEVAITASLANAAVRVDYTDAFRRYMTDYSASVRTEGSAEGHDYPSSVTDSDLFINPGDGSLYVTFTTIQGQSATLKAAEFTAEARHRYIITVDVNEGEIGMPVLSVDFDDQTVAETREFVLSDELFNAAAPEVTPATTDVTVIEGFEPASPAKVNIVAEGRLAAVTLVTESDYLLANGWPAEINLLKAGADMQQLLRSMGLQAVGIWTKPDKLAALDFSKVIASIGSAVNNSTTFRIEVEDAYGKISSPAGIINVTVEPVEFAITGHDLCMAGDDTVTLTVAFNGADINSTRFEVFHSGSGVWDEVTPVSVAPVSRAELPAFTVVLPLSDLTGDVKVRATAGSLPPVTYTVPRTVPDFTVSVTENNTFAHYAIIDVTCDDVAPASVIKILKFSVADASGAAVTGLSAVKVADSQVKLSGLPAGAALTIKGTLAGKESTASATTEVEAPIPNGDFETLVPTVNFNSLNQGGRWKESFVSSYKQTTSAIQIQEPAGWASVNEKTASTSHARQNTWFVVPSTVNTTLSWLSTVPKSAVGTNGGTDTPEAFKYLTAQSGANAMVLRNVAWDAAGVLPADKSYTAASADQYCNPNVPNIANRSAGKLFLGSYAFDGSTETYNEGVGFTSRPSSLSGYYKFERDAADPDETGMVTVQVLSGNTVIAQASKMLEPAEDYTPFSLPLTYAAAAPKATSVRVMFASSNHASNSMADETANVKTSTRVNRYEAYSIGAALTVDNLSFNY